MIKNSIIISRLFYPVEGGVETFLLEVAKAWNLGSLEVFCKKEENVPLVLDKPVKIRRFAYGNGNYSSSLFYLLKQIRQAKHKLLSLYFLFLMSINRNICAICCPFIQEADEHIRAMKENLNIQCSMPLYTGVIGLYFKLRYGIPLVIYIHGSELIYHSKTINQNLMQKFVFGMADMVISNSTFTTELAITKGCSPEKIFKTLLGANTKQFFPCESKGSIQTKYNIPKENLILLTVSHLVPRKGADMVIKAMPKILKEVQNVTYLIGGRGEYLQTLQNLVMQLNLTNNVIFLGYLQDEELNDLFNACDIFVMPNRQEDYDVEGFGIVFADAAACGKPTIAGNSGGAVDAIKDQVTGFLVDPYSASDIADKCLTLLKNEKLRQQFGMSGLERVTNELNWDSVSAKIIKEFRKHFERINI